MQESGEMYLEHILVLQQEKPMVRAIDIAERAQFSKPSVSRAVHKLESQGYLSIGENGEILLTASGRQVAEKIFERHTVLSKVLMALGVSQENATEDACRIEHVISDESFAAIKKHVQQVTGQEKADKA